MSSKVGGPATHPRRVGRWLFEGRAISVVVLVLAWQAVVDATHINPILLPPPSHLALGLWTMAKSGTLWTALAFSAKSLVPGFVLAAVIGVPMGLAMGMHEVAGDVFDPFVTVFLATPVIVFVPVMIIWFGVGILTRVVVAFIFAFPLIAINAQAGVRAVPYSLVEMARSYEVPQREIFWKVILPGSLASVIVGLRYGVAHAVKGVIIAEMLMTLSGLGGLIMAYSGAYRTGHLLAVVLLSLIIVLILTQVFTWAHRRLAPWDDSLRAGTADRV